MAELHLEAVSVLTELDRLGWAWEAAGDDEVKVRCPAHEDANPSCGINLKKRLFKCNVPTCGAKGDIVTFIGLALKEPSRRVIVEMLAQHYPIEASKTVDVEAVERWHGAVWDAGPMLGELRARGVTDEDIRQHRLGFDGRRITIPIKNQQGLYVNVRKYMPGAPGPEKMRNMRGHGEIRLFPLEQLAYDTIVICGGELKAIVTARQMNPLGIGAICATAGEGNWEPEFSRKLRGKRAFISFDIDAEGREAASRVAARCRGDVRWVGVVQLDLDPDKYPHGDNNDYFGSEKRTAEQYMALLERTEEWRPTPPPEEVAPADVPLVHLSEAAHARHTGKKLAVVGVVTGKDESPYLVPRRVECHCSRNQTFCAQCPVFAKTPDENDAVVLTIHPETPGLLLMIDAHDKAMREATRKALRIPPCKDVTFRTQEHYNVEDLRLTPQLEIGSRHEDDVIRPAYYVGHGLETNAGYRFEGRVYPHPKDQHAVMIASEARPVEDSLQSFKPTDEELEELTLFKPTEWSVAGLQEKLDDLYGDLETNVTRIWLRQDLHLAVDLSYHSALLVPFDRRTVKGWTEILVVGDSGQGKSETVEQLMGHYGLGERVVCKGATKAGLLGGLEQVGTRWFIRWGVIPTHDKRHVTLEELKGTPIEVIGSLTDMRSSGIAMVTKIEKRRTHARTRLLAISNPRGDRQMSQHNFGIEAIAELIGALEDVRRFDACFVLTRDQVDKNEINRRLKDRPQVQHRHTSELCRRLILWAWTRGPGQVTITDEATTAIMDASVRMCEKFTDAVPIVDRGSMRLKLARLATALAARTFSCANKDPRVLVVRPCHVAFIEQFLDRTYSAPEFGYADFSRALLSAERLHDEPGLRAKIMTVPFVLDFIEQMIATNSIEMRDLCDWCGWDFEEGKNLMSFLVRKHALVRDGRSYRKTAPFIALLKQMRDDPKTKALARPDHVKDITLPREM